MPVPTIEPAEITAGDTVAWTRTLPDYPASSGWSLSYALRSASAMIDIAASASGSDFAVSVLPTVSKAWAPGVYDWAAFVAKGADRFQVGAGRVVIRQNLAQAAPVDGRTHAQRVLEAIEAVIEGRATRDQEEYTIGDRSLKRTPLADLVMLHKRYQRLAANERDAAAIAAGRPNPSRFAVRFTA
jgi:hypothetical protein